MKTNSFGKKVKIKYSQLRTGDIVTTSERGLIGYCIRILSGGWFKRHSRDTASHVGIVLKVYGQVFIAEMKVKEGFDINSLEQYNSGKRRKPYFVSVLRSNVFDDSEARTELKRQLLTLKRKDKTEYDKKAIAGFVFKKVKQDPNKEICSELVAKLLIERGIDTFRYPPSKTTPDYFNVFRSELALKI